MNAVGHYKGFVTSNGLAFTSGIIGCDENNLVVAGIKQQTKIAILQLKHVLNKHNLELSDVIKTTVYITSNEDYLEMDEAYRISFSKNPPARTTVIVAELPHISEDGPETILVEIEAIVSLEHTSVTS